MKVIHCFQLCLVFERVFSPELSPCFPYKYLSKLLLKLNLKSSSPDRVFWNRITHCVKIFLLICQCIVSGLERLGFREQNFYIRFDVSLMLRLDYSHPGLYRTAFKEGANWPCVLNRALEKPICRLLLTQTEKNAPYVTGLLCSTPR